MNRLTTFRLAFQALFVLSGAAALVYQSIWSHYLGLTLGHAAYAQTLVLVMFMGGMALGAWVISRVTQKLQRPIAAYAVAEALIGVLGVSFHAIFVAYTELSQDRILPALASAQAATAWQWASAALLIAPQTVLLGSTFPLIAAGVLRLDSQQHGRTLGGLYFTNGLGAAVGALTATFVLLPQMGMPGALQVAGWINIVVALVSIVLSWALNEDGTGGSQSTTATATAAKADTSRVPLLRPLLAATFFSSAASFAYELGWVRMLNQALGTSLHSFELMLAAFIGGLALGGLWIRQVGERIVDAVRYAGFVQVAMGLCAMVSVAVLGQAYHWVPTILNGLARTETGYTLYNIATAGLAMIIMAPAAFFAGMTLPLFTAALLRQGSGERAIGQVYAANTVGAILGVLLAAHVLMPLIGVSLTLLAAGTVDLLIGLALLRGLSPKRWSPAVVAVAGIGMMVLVCMIHVGLPDRLLQSAGVFRYGKADVSGRELLYYRDGATASVAVVRQAGVTAISTNGKPDAGLTDPASPPAPDEITMVMLGALPLAMHPAPKDVAVIGWGSGLSTHTLLGSTAPDRVDTIEIERAIWEGAYTLAQRNYRAYLDSRSQVHFEDAREYFARGQRHYDVIVSEPSNPWVSGVASLFTHEFYRGVKRSLKPGGLLVQWVHSYEISDALLAEMLGALQLEFPGSQIYATNAADLIVLAPTGPLNTASDAPWKSTDLAAELRRVGLSGPVDLKARHLGGPAVLSTYIRLQGVKPHSDYFPTVSLRAPQERFRGNQAGLLLRLSSDGLPWRQVLECSSAIAPNTPIQYSPFHPSIKARQEALWAMDRFNNGGGTQPPDAALSRLIDAYKAQRQSTEPADPVAVMMYAANLAQSVMAHLPAEAQLPLWDAAEWRKAQPSLPSGAITLLSLYQAAAQKRWADADLLATAILEGTVTPRPDGIREQVLVLSMLAGMAQGQADAVKVREARWGHQIPPGSQAELRSFLNAWEADREPVCAAAALNRPSTNPRPMP